MLNNIGLLLVSSSLRQLDAGEEGVLGRGNGGARVGALLEGKEAEPLLNAVRVVGVEVMVGGVVQSALGERHFKLLERVVLLLLLLQLVGGQILPRILF